MEAILRGDVEHAFHPGGGLHHAMRDRAWGFCIYNDPALAIARARRDGLRVMYIDLDVHHGDGVQALFWDDPGVLTFSIHESGRYLFPGTGDADEVGEGGAAGSVINVPLPPYTGEDAWYPIVESYLPVLAAAFGPDLIVSQHGADSHAWDPLAHLNVTTTAHGKAARLVDAIAHRYARGRWLATGGGGYDAYRVVPRTWALTWLAGAHRETPTSTPEAWRERWAEEAARYGQAPLPERFDDDPNAGLPFDGAQEASEQRAHMLAAIHRSVVVPRLLDTAIEAGWWSPLEDPSAPSMTAASGAPGTGTPTILPAVDAPSWAGLALAPRAIAPADAVSGHALISGALRASPPAVVSAAVVGSTVVGLAVSLADRPTRWVTRDAGPRCRPRLPSQRARDRASARPARVGVSGCRNSGRARSDRPAPARCARVDRPPPVRGRRLRDRSGRRCPALDRPGRAHGAPPVALGAAAGKSKVASAPVGPASGESGSPSVGT